MNLFYSRLTDNDYKILCNKIIEIFPNEDTSIFYVPPVRKSQSANNKSIIAKGRLVDKCRNLLYRTGARSYQKKKLEEKENDDLSGNDLNFLK